MSGVDLRPLSLGEILDRTFSLYRSNFVLFIGITAIPHLLRLGVNLVNVALSPAPNIRVLTNPDGTPNLGALLPQGNGLLLGLLGLIVAVVAYLFAQGGTILAVSDLYLGRSTTITDSLRRVWDDFGALFGVAFLNGLAVAAASLLLLLPGIYLLCRLLVCVPAALIEKKGPSESLRRSMDLSRGSAGRSFVIVLLYFVLSFAVGLVFSTPLGVLLGTTARDLGTLRVINASAQISSTISAILVSPILLIATSVYYYDLRVRKEAFDLQFMMDPNPQRTPGTGDVPSIL